MGTAIVNAMVDHPQLSDIRLMLLRTRDAHGLYEEFGFRAIPAPDEMMARHS